MQSDDQLPLDAWAQAFSAARAEQGLSVVETARELMLSPAQLRDLESGSMQSFHGSGYYFRAVKKYAARLGIELNPPVESLPLTDSQLGMQRLSQSAKTVSSSATATLSRRQSTLDNGLTVAPYRSRSSRVGMVLGAILLVAVALGVYLSVKEGWPNRSGTQGSNNLLTQAAPAEATDSVAVKPKASGNSPLLDPLGPVSAVEPTALNTTTAPAEPIAEPIPEPTPEPIPEPIPEPAPPPDDILEARFTADCWVEVRYKDGRVEQKVYTEGDILTVPIEAVSGMVFGNAQAVRAQRLGQSFDVMPYARGRNVARISEADLQ